MLQGMQEPYRKEASDSILTSSLAWDLVRCSVKRRQEATVGGVIELRKIADQDADSRVSRRKAKRQSRLVVNHCRANLTALSRTPQGSQGFRSGQHPQAVLAGCISRP
jgi:hypothetical protein